MSSLVALSKSSIPCVKYNYFQSLLKTSFVSWVLRDSIFSALPLTWNRSAGSQSTPIAPRAKTLLEWCQDPSSLGSKIGLCLEWFKWHLQWHKITFAGLPKSPSAALACFLFWRGFWRLRPYKFNLADRKKGLKTILETLPQGPLSVTIKSIRTVVNPFSPIAHACDLVHKSWLGK